MNTETELMKEKIEEAVIHIRRAMELLNINLNSDICAKVDKYMKFHYTIDVEKMPDCHLFKATVKEFDDLQGYGKSHEEAYNSIVRLMRYKIKYCLENNEKIPIPKN